MKKKLSSKKCIAIILAVVMVVTSVPLMMVGALTTGAYDPAPYWGDDPNDEYGAINTNFVATLNTDGSVDISFPNANAQKTYDGSSTKTITNYVFTLTKMQEDGTRKEIYSEMFTAAQVATGVAGAKYPNHIYYGPGGLESLPDYDVQSTYDVAIMAIDSDGWFSDKIHTLLTNTPHYDITADFSPNESWVVREMLLFEQKGTADVDISNSQSNGGATVPDYSERQSADLIDVNGKMDGMGYDRSAGYRYWIAKPYGKDDKPYVMTTTWSRDHYDFTNAEEVWFYVDLRRVQINKFAFTLSANEKSVEHWRDDTTNYTSHYGVTFSTAAVAGKNTGTTSEGLYIQNADGLWESTSMTDGYFTNLSGYKGFVRIPIKYFILQSDQYITADNDLADWESNSANEGNLESYVASHHFAAGSTMVVPNSDGTTRTMTTENISYNFSWSGGDNYDKTTADAFKVNPAGTSIKDALIIYTRNERANWGGFLGIGATNGQRDMGTMISDGNTVTKSGTTYTVTDPQFAVEDLVSAGVQIADWSADSVAKSFYIDQVMFCKKNVGDNSDFDASGYVLETSDLAFPSEVNISNNNSGVYGRKMAGFYDRTKEVPKAVANYITEYVGKIPSLNDANPLSMIDDIIEAYINCFPGCSTVSDAIDYLNTKGYTDAYNRYKAAKLFIETYASTGKNSTAVEAFEAGVEKLDNPDFADYSDESLKEQLEQLMALYKSFNLSHFELLGADAEQKFTQLYSVIMGEEVKTGYSIGGYPFIPFNDFEKNISGYNANYTLGQLSLQYYDDSPAVGDKNLRPTDVNNTKNLVTYVTPDFIPQSGQNWIGNAKAVGWSVADYRATANNLLSDSNEIFDTSTYFGNMDAEISDDGFAGSQGVQINLDGDITTLSMDDSDRKFATLSTTYKGQNVNTWTDLQGLNLAALQLTDTYADGTTAKDKERYGLTTTGEQVRPNSFVMYVDFSEVTNIAMNIKFILNDGSGTDVNCYFCGGGETDTPTIYVLDENGEWTDVQISVSAIDTSSTDFKVGLCSIASAGTKLEGYKGFIRIPLSMFRIPKRDGAEENYLILENNLNNYTIAQAKVSFWDYDTEDRNIGKEISADAMGFTYDPGCQTRAISDPATIINTLNENNGLNSDVEKYGIKNMDEYFGVKTNDSVNFEKMVAELDPYEGKDAFVTAYNNAKTAYNKLSAYQKNLDEVKHCYNDLLLGKYLTLGENDGANYDTAISQEPWVAKYATADDLLTDLNLLDSKTTSFNINASEINDFYDENGVITYDDLGISTTDEALAIKELYEKGYCRLSGTQKANISAEDLAKIENAYHAASRLLLLEEYKTSIGNFSGEITKIYKTEAMTEAETGVDVTFAEPDQRMVEYNQSEALSNALAMYDGMSVFAKNILEVTASGAYNNMHAASESIYDNSAPVNIMNTGTQITGGVVAFENRMAECYDDVSVKISNKTVLDTATLNEIEYCLGQTESFLPRYAQVREINEAYHKIADLLPVADIASVDESNAELTKITLTNQSAETMEYRAYIDLSYIATRLNRSVDLYAQSSLKWTQSGGSTYKAFEDLMYDGVTADGLVDYQNADGIVTAPVGSYSNGNSASLGRYSYKISVDATEAAKVPTGSTYTGKVTFYAVDSAVVAEKTADGTDISEVLANPENILEVIEVDVEFQSTNGTDPIIYEVEIPATVQVDWDTTDAVDVSYSVEATLGSNTLSVDVADSNSDGNNLTDLTSELTDDDGNPYKLDYDDVNFETSTFTGDIQAGTKPDSIPEIEIKQEYWDEVPVGKYSTQLTYTVDVTS